MLIYSIHHKLNLMSYSRKGIEPLIEMESDPNDIGLTGNVVTNEDTTIL